jgi:hypothetical protein
LVATTIQVPEVLDVRVALAELFDKAHPVVLAPFETVKVIAPAPEPPEVPKDGASEYG